VDGSGACAWPEGHAAQETELATLARRPSNDRDLLPCLAGYLSIVTIVIATDPYDIYRWSELKLTRNDVPRDVVVRWVDVVSKQSGINTFLVGALPRPCIPPMTYPQRWAEVS
jgi:hypothetical protein